VDADVSEAEVHPNADKPDFAEMKSKPGFEVELIRGSQTLGFTCSFLGPEQQTSEDGYSKFKHVLMQLLRCTTTMPLKNVQVKRDFSSKQML
jgi:hypothetical protein